MWSLRRVPLWLLIACVVGAAGPIPLALSGYLGLRALRRAAGREVEAKNGAAAQRAAELVRRHVLKYREMMVALAGTLENSTHLQGRQMERILKNHLLDVRDFRALDVVAPDGHEIATGRADGRTGDRSGDAAAISALAGQDYYSPVRIGTNVEPEMVVAVPIYSARRVQAALVATVNLTEMWSLVEDLAPAEGTARIIDAEGRMIAASGDRDKEAVFELSPEPQEAPRIPALAPPQVLRYGRAGDQILRAGAPIAVLRWRAVLDQPVHVAFAAVDEQEGRLGVTVVVCLLLTAVVGVLGSRLVTRPAAALAERTREIARGELAGRTEPRGPSELAALADAINRMSEDLMRLQDEMRARERLSTFAKFGAGLVHDLKTPIHALQMNAMLAANATDEETRAEAMARLNEEKKVIERHLELLRNFARGDTIELRPVLADAGAFLERVAARARTRWSHVDVVTRPPPSPARLYIDPGFMERVVENLAKNAVEAMANAKRRKLELCASHLEKDNQTEIVVADTGPGIAPEILAKLFQPFYTTKPNGLGIGLALSRWIVKESGGDIACESSPEVGTTFRIVLPSAPP
jgi:signal transduction histidine kinase